MPTSSRKSCAGQPQAVEVAKRHPAVAGGSSSLMQPHQSLATQCIQRQRRRAEQQPKHRIQETHLPFDVVFHPAVIPHAELQPKVKDTPADQLHCGDAERAQPAPHRERGPYAPPHLPNELKARPADKEHTPMCPSAPRKLDEVVPEPADGE